MPLSPRRRAVVINFSLEERWQLGGVAREEGEGLWRNPQEGLAVHRVGVCCAVDVRPRPVHRRVDHEGGDVQALDWPRFRENLAFVVDQDEVFGLDEGEMDALRYLCGCHSRREV